MLPAMSFVPQFAILYILLGFSWVAVNTEKYQPVYVVYQNQRYTMADLVTCEGGRAQCILLAPGHLIEAACPKKDDDGITLEVTSYSEERALVDIECDEPVKPFIRKYRNYERYVIGYLVYKQDSDFTAVNINKDLPKTHNQINWMIVNFDKNESRTSSVWYGVPFGEFTQIEPSHTHDDTLYDNQLEIYGFNLDQAYSKENQFTLFANEFGHQSPSTLVKISLAPEEDFYLENWKKVTRVSLNAAAIWENLLPQWRDLGKFVRKVGRILGILKISSGVSDNLFLTAGENDVKPVHLYDNQKHTVPKYFWKVVATHHKTTDNSPMLSYGILLIMLNNPHEISEKPLCEDIAVQTGWHHFLKSDEKRKIYACQMTIENIRQIRDLRIEEHEPLNLHDTTKTSYDHQNGTEKLEKIDVIKEMQTQGLIDAD